VHVILDLGMSLSSPLAWSESGRSILIRGPLLGRRSLILTRGSSENGVECIGSSST